MNLPDFVAELKRRNVYKVAVAYAVVGWLLIQSRLNLFPTFEAPDWVMKVIVTAIVTGFPIALVIAWAFEMTPEGMKRTENLSPNEHLRAVERRSSRRYIVRRGAVLSVGLLLFQSDTTEPSAAHGESRATRRNLRQRRSQFCRLKI